MSIIFFRMVNILFYGSIDLEVAQEWVEIACRVLTHMGCQLKLFVDMATEATQHMGKI